MLMSLVALFFSPYNRTEILQKGTKLPIWMLFIWGDFSLYKQQSSDNMAVFELCSKGYQEQ